MIHEWSEASFTFIALFQSKVTEKCKTLPFLAYSCVQINACSMVTVPRFLWKIWKSISLSHISGLE